jgi:hypothetical protein
MSDNPLKAYFRRPALYFKLPSEAKYYPPGTVNIPPNGELAVYPMTSLDEISIRTPDGLFNGASVVAVVKNCIPDILDPWQLNDIDLEAVIIAIRAASVDNELEIISVCPSCKEDSKYDINLLQLLATKKDIDYNTPLEIKDISIKFKPLNFAQTNKNGLTQFELQRTISMLDDIEDQEKKQQIMTDSIAKLNEMILDVVCQTIESIATPEVVVTNMDHIREFLVECDSKTSKKIKEYSAELRQKNETKPLNIKCIHCQHEYEQPLVLNFTDFFD